MYYVWNEIKRVNNACSFKSALKISIFPLGFVIADGLHFLGKTTYFALTNLSNLMGAFIT